jgi:exonuclease III
MAAGLVDAWHASGHSEDEVDPRPREGRIDHVFVTPGLAKKVTGARIGYGVPASDHWPVFVELAL